MFWWDLEAETWYRLAHFTLPFMVFFGLAGTLSAFLVPSSDTLVVENVIMAAVFGYIHRYCKLEMAAASGEGRGKREGRDTEKEADPQPVR